MKILIRKYPYRQKKDLAEELGLSRTTIYERCKEIEEEQWDRYGDYAVIRDGHITLINVLAFLDYLKYRDSLIDTNTRKFVPAYDPNKVAMQLGWKGSL